MTRAMLDAEWERFVEWACWRTLSPELLRKALARRIAEERAYVDREMQARAIRWASVEAMGSWRKLESLANRVERGETEVPK